MSGGPSPERLRKIAMNRLRAIGIQAWAAQDWVKGRILFPVEQFARYAGVVIEPEQHFLVYQHAFLAFPPPSPLTHLGGIRFYEEPSLDALVESIKKRWAELVKGTEAALDHARGFRPDAYLDVASWNLETAFVDGFGRVSFRFDGRLSMLYPFSVGDTELVYDEQNQPLMLPLQGVTTEVTNEMLMPLVREARKRVGAEESASDAGPIELALDSITIDPSLAAPALKIDSDSDDLSFPDLDALKTGDLSILPSQDLAAEPMVLDMSVSDDIQETVSAQPQQERHPRMPQSVPAQMVWSGGASSVVLADVSAGGLFVRLDAGAPPPEGEVVHLSGFASFAVSATVAFHRPAEEAALFQTGPGIGLAFKADFTNPTMAGFQDRPVGVVLLRDEEACAATRNAMEEAGIVSFTADHAASLAILMLHFSVTLVVMDPEIAESVSASLALGPRGAKVLIGPQHPASLRAALE